MRAFHFRLEGILRLRRQVEDGRLRDFGRARQQSYRCEQEIQLLLMEAVHARARLRRLGEQERIDIRGIRGGRQYLHVLEDRGRRKSGDLMGLRREEERLRALYLDARKDRRVLERLRERRQRAYRKEYGRYEVKEQDESNARRVAGGV